MSCNCGHSNRKKSKKSKKGCGCGCRGNCEGNCCRGCGCGPRDCGPRDCCEPCPRPPFPRQTSLLVTIAPTPQVVAPGNIITVAVTVTNLGNVPAEDTRLLVQLPSPNIFNWRSSSVNCHPQATLNSLSFRCPAGTIFPGSSRFAIFQAVVPALATQITYQINAVTNAENATQVSAQNSFTVTSNLLNTGLLVPGATPFFNEPFVGSGLGGLTNGPLII